MDLSFPLGPSWNNHLPRISSYEQLTGVSANVDFKMKLEIIKMLNNENLAFNFILSKIFHCFWNLLILILNSIANGTFFF